MLFKTQIIALAILACGLPSLGQNRTVSGSRRGSSNPVSGSRQVSTAQSYKDMLQASSEDDPQSGQTPDSDAAREAYKQHLRQMSGDGDREEGTGDSDQAASGDKNDSGKRSSGSGKGTALATPPAAEASSQQPVASQATAARKSSDAAASSVAPSNKKSLENVSLQQKGPSSSSADVPPVKPVSLQQPASDLPAAISQQPAATCDSYCQQLKKTASSQQPAASSRSLTASILHPAASSTTERNFIKNLAFDQVHIWASPFKLRDTDATWAIPFGIVTGSLIATDRDLSKQAATPSRLSKSKQISDAGLYSFIGAGAGFYGVGLLTHDDHKRETGLLSGEAFVNATLVAEALKVVVGRQRPFEGDHFGHIGRGGSSFPSEHAIGSFAIASVIAHEYPNPFVQIGAYGLAATVAATRVTAGQHFPSDVLVGSAFGYLIGRKIYNDHHNPELGGAEYGTFVREHKYDAEHSGSAYVPLESWVYPVIDRLAALGLVHSNFDSERPFTRLECARLAQEAIKNSTLEDPSADTRAMVDSLQQEFSRETEVWAGDSNNRSAEVESVYTRLTEIAGPVLRDGYHFGQTLYNDYGRPYGRGFNEITGFSARATAGPLVLYFRGEHQHAPGNPPYSPKLQASITAADGNPPADQAFPAEDRFRVMDAYIGLNFNNNQLSIGQQSLSWGPGTGGSLVLSNNAEPLKMVRLTSVSPIEIPLLSRFLGPLRYDMFVGQTDGHHFMYVQGRVIGPNIKQPLVQGQRFSFKPTPNLEFGISKTGTFGGTGYPLTADYFFRTTLSTAQAPAGDPRKPGDRDSGFDLTYRIPKLRDRLTWYLEERAEDEASPLFFPRTSAMRSGIYLPRLPKLPKLDLRVEGTYTDIPNYGQGPGYFYANFTYRGGFTKNGDLLGSWLGRDGRGIYASSTWWLSARKSLTLGYREATADNAFVEGGRYQDASVKATLDLRKNFTVSGMLQYEHWRFPALALDPQNNFTSSLQIQYAPPAKR